MGGDARRESALFFESERAHALYAERVRDAYPRRAASSSVGATKTSVAAKGEGKKKRRKKKRKRTAAKGKKKEEEEERSGRRVRRTEARGRERERKGRRCIGSNAAKLATSGAMVCGAVKYKPEGEGGQEEEEKKEGEEKEMKEEWNERGESPRARLRTERRDAWGG